MKELIIFDLDGILLSTIADPVYSTSHASQVLGYLIHEVISYNFMVDNGISKLFEHALPEGEKTEENVSRIRKESLLHCDRRSADENRPYLGIPELLGALQNKGHKLAAAFSKYQVATEKLIVHYLLGIRFVTVFGQREGVKVKPDPTMVYDIPQIADVPKEEVLYIGDSGVDMQTAINGEVTSCRITWGFRPRMELESFYPDFVADKAEATLSTV